VVLPIYAASEEPIAGITGQALAERIIAHGHKQVVFAEGIAAAAAQLKALLASGDLLLTLGAGDVWKVGSELLRGI
jgi:UDP-N-acetylmuramate--alanine ligase